MLSELMSHGENRVKLKPNIKIQLDSPNTCENQVYILVSSTSQASVRRNLKIILNS